MGQKTHPIGFRLSLTKQWKSIWHDDRRFKEFLHKDIELRKFLHKKLRNADVARVEIYRKINETEITIRVAKPGLVIGKGGASIEELRRQLRSLVDGKLKLNVVEVKKPMLSSKLVVEMMINQIIRRYPYKRAVNQALAKVMEAGAQGVKITLSGVLSGPSSIARTEKRSLGSVPTSTLKSNIDFDCQTAITSYGTIGVKVWIYNKDK